LHHFISYLSLYLDLYFSKGAIRLVNSVNKKVSKSSGVGIDFPNPSTMPNTTPIVRKTENAINSFLCFLSKRGGTSNQIMAAAIKRIPILFSMMS